MGSGLKGTGIRGVTTRVRDDRITASRPSKEKVWKSHSRGHRGEGKEK